MTELRLKRWHRNGWWSKHVPEADPPFHLYAIHWQPKAPFTDDFTSTVDGAAAYERIHGGYRDTLGQR